MKKGLLLAGAFLTVIVAIVIFSLFDSKASPQEAQASIYDFKPIGLDGKPVDFSQYKGKFILIVNTASRCKYTPQYADLEKLHEQFGNKVAVLGFPANNFFWEEPGSNDQIQEFCRKNYGVKFQMFSKVSVKGRDKDPLFKWLTAKTGESPTWNFCKYLVDQEGKSITFYNSKVSPLDERIVGAFK